MSPVSRSPGPGRRRRRRRFGPCVRGADRDLALPLGRTLDLAIALENDPKEIRAAAVDAQRMSDWLLARERDRTQEEERAESGRGDGGEPHPVQPQRKAEAVAAREAGLAERDAPRPEVGLSR